MAVTCAWHSGNNHDLPLSLDYERAVERSL
jgi:hypothetical protein